jgi:Rhodopirellula transposase DDE domain
LQHELKEQGHRVSRTKLSGILKELGYSLQSNRKTREGQEHPERNQQFEHIARRVKAYQHGGRPAISVDTKKKEVLGTKANKGQEYRPKGEPLEVDTHDFPDKQLGKAVPYGVYDIAENEAWVSVGISSDTAEFAVEAIRRWWYELQQFQIQNEFTPLQPIVSPPQSLASMRYQGFQPLKILNLEFLYELGQVRYLKPYRLLITADSGGSNGHRNRLWKLELQRLADEMGFKIEVCHYPPGTSKWNKIEHRLFCHITRNWRGVPLETHQIVVNLVSSTRTEEGLEVHCWLDSKTYETGRKVTDEEMSSVRLKRNSFHGDWNYEIHPRRAAII